ncbi:MAG: TonB-dependent receptor [Acidaminococcales bacterium]|jgi:outer membrane receptor for ferrienterochelin and colicins|nr:TonB-dependent receptor [Acidaminococcales bacterium]
MRKKSKQFSTGKITALTLAAFNFLLLPALAAEAEEEDAGVTREVIVTASRTEQEIKETPSSVEVVTREEIETMGAQTVRDALALAVGVDFPTSGTTGNHTYIRGLSSAYVLIMVDGRRVPGEDGSLANQYWFDRINLDNVERIEIVRGPGSSLYGSDAMGGVINIITRRPEKAGASIHFDGGSRLYGGGLRVDSGTAGRWAWTFDANFQRTRTRKQDTFIGGGLTYPIRVPGGDTKFYNLKGTYNINDKQKIDIFYEKSNQQWNYFQNTTEYINDSKGDSFGLTYRGKGEKSDYELRAYYNRMDRWAPSLNLSTSAFSFDVMKYTAYVVEGRDSIQIDDKHRLTFGGEYRALINRSTRLGAGGDKPSQITINGVTRNISERSEKYQSVYLQDEWLLSDKLLVIPSLRYDHNSSFGGNLSPKIGLTYKFSDDYRLKASYGKGFRAPDISYLYMDFGGMIGNPDLKPEKTTGYEISIEGEKKGYSGKLTYFRTDARDLISMYTAAPPYTYINISKAQMEGIEAEIGKKLNEHFTLKASHVYLDALNKVTGARLTNRARNNTKLQLIYNDARRGWGAIFWNEWLHDYWFGGKNYSYPTFNFSVNKKWQDGKYSAYFAVDNIADKKILDVWMYQGRVWRLGVNITL